MLEVPEEASVPRLCLAVEAVLVVVVVVAVAVAAVPGAAAV